MNQLPFMNQLQTMLHRISLAVQKTPDWDGLLLSIHNIVRELMQIDDLQLYVLQPESATLSPLYPANENQPPLCDKQFFIKIVEKYQVELQKNHGICRFDQWSQGEKNAYVFGSCCFSLENEIIGILILQKITKTDPFLQHEVELLEYIGTYIALTLQRKRAEDALRESENVKTVLFQISNAIITAQTIAVLALSIHQILQKHVYAHNFIILLVNDATHRLEAEYYVDETELRCPKLVGEIDIRDLSRTSPSFEVVRTGKPLFKSVRQLSDEGIPPIGTQAKVWLGVPLRIQDKVIGVMIVQDYHNPDLYTEKDVAFMMSISEQVALAIGHIRNLNTIQQNMQELERLYNTALDSNPLTGLPGNNSVASRIKKALEKKEQVCVIYSDLDNFKAFNDKYGFTKGDDVIRYTCKILEDAVVAIKYKDAFVGHIGGDDFVVIVPSGHCREIVHTITNSFDVGIVNFYSPGDQLSKNIQSVNRQGKSRAFPLMSISLAVVDLSCHFYSKFIEVNDACAEAKKMAKAIPGSSFFIDRRTSQ